MAYRLKAEGVRSTPPSAPFSGRAAPTSGSPYRTRSPTRRVNRARRPISTS
nr:MAG TPA: hypothetical protein [Caudoviricetes sp.]